jgi:murein DD-endopeptidase MepM/ murein hydrolase activator NlpD
MKLEKVHFGSKKITVMLIPEGGQGKVQQLSISLRQLQLTAAGTACTALVAVVAVGAHAYTLPRAVEAPVLAQENLRLQSELEQANRTIGEVSELVDRLNTYDERLKELEAQGALPGMGPLTEAELEARASWLEGKAEEKANGELKLRADGLWKSLVRFDEGHLKRVLSQLENRETVMPLLWPANGPVTSGFGYRKSPFNGDWGMHGGIDIGARYGEPILATNQGIITFSGWDSGHGNMVVLDHGQGIVTRYCHASSLLVAAGDSVVAGETLALVGSTGWSTGPHLHYEIFIDGERANPLDYLP